MIIVLTSCAALMLFASPANRTQSASPPSLLPGPEVERRVGEGDSEEKEGEGVRDKQKSLTGADVEKQSYVKKVCLNILCR